VGAVIGDLLPLAVVVAVSPVPIIAAILMLLAPRAGSTSLGFLLGWVLGVVVAVTVFLVIAAHTGMGTTGAPSTASLWVKLLLGIALIALAARQWRRRPHPGDAVALPKWMSAIDAFTPAKAAGLGFLLAAVNPKNLAMAIAAGVTIAGGHLSAGGNVVAVAGFTVIACCTVAVPVIGYRLAADRMRAPLDRLKTWLEVNNAAVMSVLLLVIGAVLAGKGLGGLL
jgi:threonine/homoserine/homoserine lactone efflux protein